MGKTKESYDINKISFQLGMINCFVEMGNVIVDAEQPAARNGDAVGAEDVLSADVCPSVLFIPQENVGKTTLCASLFPTPKHQRSRSVQFSVSGLQRTIGRSTR